MACFKTLLGDSERLRWQSVTWSLCFERWTAGFLQYGNVAELLQLIKASDFSRQRSEDLCLKVDNYISDWKNIL